MSRTRCVAVVHLWCATCGHPVSARTLEASREALLDHLTFAWHPRGQLQVERLQLAAGAERVLSGGTR